MRKLIVLVAILTSMYGGSQELNCSSYIFDGAEVL